MITSFPTFPMMTLKIESIVRIDAEEKTISQAPAVHKAHYNLSYAQKQVILQTTKGQQ